MACKFITSFLLPTVTVGLVSLTLFFVLKAVLVRLNARQAKDSSPRYRNENFSAYTTTADSPTSHVKTTWMH